MNLKRLLKTAIARVVLLKDLGLMHRIFTLTFLLPLNGRIYSEIPIT